MRAARTLEPGDHLSHYRVVGPLGAGGMGEVYLARDQDLERNVAIKVLPTAVVQNEERLRRFVLEAKSASSLNHPSIVTIYEIGQSHVASATGERNDASSSVHFISMELVTGKTLSSLIHEDKTDLRTLLGYLAQAADGLAKAHAAGIVHRDLKPGNIMVSADGFAKVLDFGLAKLTEKRESSADLSTAATVADATGEGVVLGTTNYMSPEQVQGKPVDHRSDVFSFGSILYEAATGRQPFKADSAIEIMHRIVNDRPAPVEELNPKVPSEVRRLIRRCLSKNPEQRFQSMKDLAIELREIVDEYDSLSPSGGSTTGVSTTAPPIPAARRVPAWALWGTAIAIVAAIGVTVFILRRGADISGGPSSNLRMTTVTSRGDASDAVLSPDGRFVAFASGPEGARRLWVRQVATGSDVEVLRQQAVPISGLTFSPDGNYIYYQSSDIEHPGYKALFRIPTLGGAPVRIVYDIDTPISFAPDGRHVCFARGIPAKRLVSLIDMDLEGAQERTIASIALPRLPQAFPKWSPRGDRIAMAESDSSATLGIRITIYRVADGRREVLKAGPWPRVAGLTWDADGRGLLLSAIDLSGSPAMQIVYVPFPSGPVRKVTHDINQYGAPSVSADGKAIATLRNTRSANLWIVPTEENGGEPHPLTATTGADDAIGDFTPGDAGDILFTSLIGQYLHLSTIRTDGSGQRALSTGHIYVLTFKPVEGGAVTMQVGEDLAPHLWRLERDTGAQTQLTRGPGETLEGASRDGKLIAFTRIDAPSRLLVMPAEGGESRTLVEDFENSAEFSPDGQRLRYRALRTVEGRPIFTMAVCMTATGAADSIPVVPRPIAGLTWSPDGQAFTFEDRADTAWNVCRRLVHGGPVERLTHFTDRRVTGHGWSPDGRWLLISVQSGGQSNLWIAGSDGRSPRPLTSFRTGTIFGADCTRDSKYAVFSYGNESQDVVLIQGFK